MKTKMTSMERVLTALSHKEPDQVPLILMLTIQGAKILQIPIKEYLKSPSRIVQAQLLMKEKFNNDCVTNITYAALEVEAFGGEVIFTDDGPPNAGQPILKSASDIKSLTLPRIEETKCLMRALEITEKLYRAVGNTTPILGLVISPFSLPIMQLGFEKYLQLLYHDPDNFNLLMKKNKAFCIQWANAQLKAGATAITYFDPLASPTIIERATYLKKAHPTNCEVLDNIQGATCIHLASGVVLPVAQDLLQTRASVISISNLDNVEALKSTTKDKIAIIGNLNGIDMVNWTKDDVHQEVKSIIAKAAKGGGFLLSDCHGEIPYQVTENTLLEISHAIQEWGQYPLEWIHKADE